MKFLFIAIVVFSLYYVLSREEPERPSVQQEESLDKAEPFSDIVKKEKEKLENKEKPVIVFEQTVEQESRKLKPQPSQATDGFSKYKSVHRKTVDFKVVGNLAIAFGDVILGEVKNGQPGQQGEHTPKAVQLWKSATIPYGFHKDLKRVERVEEVIQYFNASTPIRFVPYQGQKDALFFVPFEENCASYLGMKGGHQPIMLSDKCEFKEIAHEIMHALGFVHEQSRPVRDRWVEILWDNIQEGFEAQFSIVPGELVESYGGSPFVFDYDSIMLYLPNAFAKQPQLETMNSLTNTPIPSMKKELSRLDIDRLYHLYGGL